MDTRQIEQILSFDKYTREHLVVVCAHDHLDYHITRALQQPRRTAAFIFNLDPSYLPGSHWVAMFLDFNGHGEYFDPTGLPPDLACRDLMRRTCPRPPLHNTRPLQDDTFVCGQFCIVYLFLRCRGYAFDEIVEHLDTPQNDRLVFELLQPYFPGLPFK